MRSSYSNPNPIKQELRNDDEQDEQKELVYQILQLKKEAIKNKNFDLLTELDELEKKARGTHQAPTTAQSHVNIQPQYYPQQTVIHPTYPPYGAPYGMDLIIRLLISRYASLSTVSLHISNDATNECYEWNGCKFFAV